MGKTVKGKAPRVSPYKVKPLIAAVASLNAAEEAPAAPDIVRKVRRYKHIAH